uniref:Uncharacterized protein n=1 Tax=Arundo donax TaxID=35708 RepID=A0A0A9F335_ARUDO
MNCSSPASDGVDDMARWVMAAPATRSCSREGGCLPDARPWLLAAPRKQPRRSLLPDAAVSRLRVMSWIEKF